MDYKRIQIVLNPIYYRSPIIEPSGYDGVL